MMIIKIGGGKSINLEGIISDLSYITEPFIIVHGANAVRDELATLLNKPQQTITSVSGYSSVFSDNDSIDLLMMAYAGLKNKRIVELCQKYGINAIGLTGIDGKLIQGKRNTGIRVYENNKLKIKHDLSGKPQQVNKDLLDLLLNNGYIPVITIPIIDACNQAINTENDDVITLLQSTIIAETIIEFIEAPGFLEDINNPTTIVKKISKNELHLREEQVQGRMKRKIHALKKLTEFGNTKIIISDGRVEHPLENALEEHGTIII